ncbi:MAG: pyridoxal-phosphate dependent enzyme [Thermomicrobiales bacterium]|nr:pyridoxal-phosphate dependent enzyme [Thermomicrobiales bacterium]
MPLSDTQREPATTPEANVAQTASPVTLEDIRAAAERIRPYVHRTPLLPSQTLSRMSNTRLALKPENLQRTGSFKARGALNAMLQLSPEQRERGVVTLSAGNHGQGLAFAAGLLGVRCVVFMPETAVPTKVAAIAGYGAETRFTPTMAQAPAAVETYQKAQGLTYVHPFGDPNVIAGQGTIGLELLEDEPDLDAVVVPVGGGGLLAGVATAIKALRPDVRVVGVEPEGAPSVSRSLAAGHPITLDRLDTIADGLAAPFAAPISQALIERNVDDVVLVSDDEIVDALRLILERTKLLVEPSGAAGVAALLSGKTGVAAGAQVAAILSGGNVDRERLKQML